MEIVVEGRGEDFFTPNLVVLTINFNGKGVSYQDALEKGLSGVSTFIQEVLSTNGFTKEDMKTRSFVVKENKRYNDATRIYEFDGYSFTQNAILMFDYDKEKLAKIIDVTSRLEHAPLINVNFSVKDEKECRKSILSKAYKDAEEQASAIALAAGKTLVGCKKVDFKPFNDNYVSKFSMEADMCYAKAGFNAAQEIVNSFTPEDVLLEEKLYCLWIAE